MSAVLAAIATAFGRKGWSSITGDGLTDSGFEFDAAFESPTAIVFCEELAVERLTAKVASLSEQVAAVTQRSAAGSKAWEGYLLLLCHGDLLQHEREVQSVQYDLSYCRKIVIPADQIEFADDPVSAAEEALAFLFPLELGSAGPAFDVRSALVDHLATTGISRELAADLVDNFDESACKCTQRLLECVREGAKNELPPRPSGD